MNSARVAIAGLCHASGDCRESRTYRHKGYKSLSHAGGYLRRSSVPR